MEWVDRQKRDAEIVRRVRQGGWSVEQAANEYGLHIQTVYAILRKVDPGAGRLNYERRHRWKWIADEARKGTSVDTLAERFRLSRRTIYRACEAHGVRLCHRLSLRCNLKLLFNLVRDIADGRDLQEISQFYCVPVEKLRYIGELAHMAGCRGPGMDRCMKWLRDDRSTRPNDAALHMEPAEPPPGATRGIETAQSMPSPDRWTPWAPPCLTGGQQQASPAGSPTTPTSTPTAMPTPTP